MHKDHRLSRRNLAVFCILSSLTAFDFHRDSFINLDLWSALGMAFVVMWERDTGTLRSSKRTSGNLWRIFFATAFAAVCFGLGLILARPVTYQASATVLPKGGAIMVMPSSYAGGAPKSPSVTVGSNSGSCEILLGSREVAARMITAEPDLVHGVLKAQDITASSLADYISNNVTMLMANRQTTLTFQYRNHDPKLAVAFLAAVLDETDRTIVDVSGTIKKVAGTLSCRAGRKYRHCGA